MYRFAIVEESLSRTDILTSLEPFFSTQKSYSIPDNALPIWHINEYLVPDDKLSDFLPIVKARIMPTWFATAYNDDKLIVIFRGRSFKLPKEKNKRWDSMLIYGESVGVEKSYLEDLPRYAYTLFD